MHCTVKCRGTKGDDISTSPFAHLFTTSVTDLHLTPCPRPHRPFLSSQHTQFSSTSEKEAPAVCLRASRKSIAARFSFSFLVFSFSSAYRGRCYCNSIGANYQQVRTNVFTACSARCDKSPLRPKFKRPDERRRRLAEGFNCGCQDAVRVGVSRIVVYDQAPRTMKQ
jgi:hypothetical protein